LDDVVYEPLLPRWREGAARSTGADLRGRRADRDLMAVGYGARTSGRREDSCGLLAACKTLAICQKVSDDASAGVTYC